MSRSAADEGDLLLMGKSSADDRTLVGAARRGDVGAFEELVRRHYDTLYRFALGITRGNEAEAADLLQEALIKAFLAINRFEGKSSFSSWLWRIIRNEYTDHLRRSHGEPVPLEQASHLSAADSTPEETVLAEERRRLLWRMIASLPEIFADAVILVELMELSYEEAADYLDIPIGSLKSRLARARERLVALAEKERELLAHCLRPTE